jgi:secreted PhoX family phosphatase
MAKDFSLMEDSNRSSNPSIHRLSDPARRRVLQGGLAAAVSGLFAPLTSLAQSAPAAPMRYSGKLGFVGVSVATTDTVTVPMGYTAEVLYRWGDTVGIAGNLPAYKPDASNTAAEQAAQAGMHHDGIHFFPLDGSKRGLLAMNHEYVDDGLLHTDGMRTWSAEKVAKSQAAHGVSVIEVAQTAQGWQVVRPSRYARRITATTPMRIAGPAAGHAMMRTAADPEGTRVLGTMNNCAHGFTPWGTYLTCEENFINYFAAGDNPDAHARRWGARKETPYRWAEFDERFDMTRHPNEFNRFGWVVEIDPMDPTSTPIKRTALGRAAHEGATVTTSKDGRAVVYMGEDARFEYIYKFVSRDRIRPGGAAANRDLLDHGTLYVARFDAGGHGCRRLCHPGRRGHQGPAGERPRGRHQDGPPRMDCRGPEHRRGLLHPDQQQRARPREPPRRGCRQPARRQHLRRDHPLEGRRRHRCHPLCLGPLRAGRRPGQCRRQQAGHHPWRRVRQPGRHLGGFAQHRVDPD